MDFSNSIPELIEHILSYKDNIEKLTRPNLGEEFNFENCSSIFNNIFTLLTPLKEFDFSIAPLLVQNQFGSALNEIKQDFAGIEGFSLKGNNIQNHHASITNSLRRHYDEFFKELTPIIAIKSTIYPEQNKASAEIKKLLSDSKDASAEVIRLRDDINKIHEDAQRAVGEIGVAKYSEMFEKQYSKHESSASWWLMGMVGILVSIILTGVVFWINDEVENNNAAGIVHFAFIRLLFLTVLFYALNVCSKNYKSHKHNSIVNKHRANALNTFQTFVDAAKDDDDTKNAVLLEAARTIFSSHQTAYHNNENETEFPIKIIEMIKSSKGQGT